MTAYQAVEVATNTSLSQSDPATTFVNPDKQNVDDEAYDLEMRIPAKDLVVTGNDLVVKFPTELRSFSAYRVVIPAGLVTDLSESAFPGASRYHFSTGIMPWVLRRTAR